MAVGGWGGDHGMPLELADLQQRFPLTTLEWNTIRKFTEKGTLPGQHQMGAIWVLCNLLLAAPFLSG